MADDAVASIQATVLPDEIAKTISATMTITPADANDKWYYKLTSVSNSSTDLIAGDFIDYTSVDDDTATTAVHANDKAKFLFIKNVNSSDASIFICFDGGTAASDLVDGVTIGQNEFFCARLPNTTVANIHAISSSGTVTCVVAALLDDVAQGVDNG